MVPAGPPEGMPLPTPGDPRAGATGRVRFPDLDIGEMVNVVAAQRMVEINVTTVERAAEAYRSLLDVGDRRRDLASDPYA